ncbi:MAG: response regulator [Elainella sp.]
MRVDIQRLERMNNLVGELAINRNSLSLQNDQMQSSVRDLVERFERFQGAIGQLQDLSDRMLVTPAQRTSQRLETAAVAAGTGAALTASFDSLEMDRYSLLHFELQDIFEQVMQIEEALGDVSLFSAQSSQTLNEQRQKMIQLQNELMWARMLPLGNVLNRFPRVLRDLSAKYNKSVALRLSGTGVLVDKMVLEKLYDPLLHLLRNAFDHGIEAPSARRSQDKAEQGTIEIRAYHRGNQTLIEVVDDGKGLDVQRIGQRAVELGWLTPQDLESAKPNQILDFIFEPGFSTAEQVSELSGRGVGLDVVRAQLRSLKGSVSATSLPGKGTTFTLRIPLTLTVAKLLTCSVGATAIAVPSDSIEEILVPKPTQLKQSGGQQFLYWREQLVPIYRMGQLLNYSCVVPERSTSDSLTVAPMPKDWTSPLLVIQRDQHSFAIEVDRLITEQELVIKPFGASIAPPAYTYGCTILGDGSLVPVIDAATLVDLTLNREASGSFSRPAAQPPRHQPVATSQTVKTVLVVDDSATLRRMLALTLEKSGYRVLQARDGREALTHLEQGASVQIVICDIEMPNMNGFEFLSQRRQTPEFAQIPVMMLTSRSNDKHRRLAMHLGATAYFSKPYVEHDLLSALQTLLSAAA